RLALYDGIPQLADLGDGDADGVAGLEGEVVAGDQTGAGEEEDAVREEVVPPQPLDQLREGALHLGGARRAVEYGPTPALDRESDVQRSLPRFALFEPDHGAEAAGLAVDLRLREVERVLALDVAGAHVVSDRVADQLQLRRDQERDFRLGDVPPGVAADA